MGTQVFYNKIVNHTYKIHFGVKWTRYDDMFTVFFCELPHYRQCFHTNAKVECVNGVLLPDFFSCFLSPFQKFINRLVFRDRLIDWLIVIKCSNIGWLTACARNKSSKARNFLFSSARYVSENELL